MFLSVKTENCPSYVWSIASSIIGTKILPHSQMVHVSKHASGSNGFSSVLTRSWKLLPGNFLFFLYILLLIKSTWQIKTLYYKLFRKVRLYCKCITSRVRKQKHRLSLLVCLYGRYWKMRHQSCLLVQAWTRHWSIMPSGPGMNETLVSGKKIESNKSKGLDI